MVRVVYVGGWQRNGTTLLGDLLALPDGVLHAGEISGVWDAAARGAACSCGPPVGRCPVWGAALDRLRADGVDETAWRELADATASHFRTRNVRRLEAERRHGSTRADLHRVVARTAQLVDAALELTGSDYLVDTSKMPAPMYLHALAGRKMAAVQIVRDARAVAGAELRTRSYVNGNAAGQPPGSDVLTSLRRWYRVNATVAVLPHVMGLPTVSTTYEQLTADPRATIRRIAERTGLPFDPDAIGADGSYAQPEHHVAVGNPMRMAGGIRRVEPDLRWQRELQGRDRVVAETLSMPGRLVLQMIRFGRRET